MNGKRHEMSNRILLLFTGYTGRGYLIGKLMSDGFGREKKSPIFIRFKGLTIWHNCFVVNQMAENLL